VGQRPRPPRANCALQPFLWPQRQQGPLGRRWDSFLAWLAAHGVATPRVSGTLDRFAYANGRAWFTLRERPGVYTIVDPAGADVLLARPGEHVSFETSADENGARLVRGFTDASIRR